MVGNSETDPIQEDQETASRPLYYIGIGASAGGLEALEAFFTNMPAESGMAFIVIQHLSPDYKSMMVELLSKHTRMPVRRAEDGLLVEPNCVYLIPPKKNLRIFHGRLLLSDQDPSRGVNLPIDIFLQSLAEDQAEKAIGIILSGTGSDGMRGIRMIKQMGGIVFVQSIESSRFDGMPRSALSTGLADFILPPEEMPAYLLSLKNRINLQTASLSKSTSAPTVSMDRLFGLIRETTKVDFTYYKPSTIVRRVERRMVINQINDLDEYMHFLERNPSEVQTLYRELLIGVTSFFRDKEVFEELGEKYLPEAFTQNEEVRIWVAGCSTGEEVYTIAILCREAMQKTGLYPRVKIFATDIDREALIKAGTGIYPESIAADVPMQYLAKYFQYKDGTYQVDHSLREMVVFAVHNLIKDPPFTNLNLISCRNLLIYLQPVLQQKAISLFNFALKPHGLLLLGTSEAVSGSEDLFEPLNIRFRIYKSRGIQRPIPALKQLPSSWQSNSSGESGAWFFPKSLPLPGSYEKIYERFLNAVAEEFLPLSIIVNQQMEILHIIGDASNYLRVPSGKMTNDITRLAIKELSIPLATGLQKMFKNQQPVHYTNLSVYTQSGKEHLNLTIKPLRGRKDQEMLAAVFVQSIEPKNSPKEENNSLTTYSLSEQAEQRIRDLENELQFTRENLQATIEELETSNEELQATNEELMASNQELQSANEELQSVNEELYTVNAEFQNKILELTELTNDLNNLVSVSQVATLFLDEDLIIRRYTPEALQIFAINQNDIGKPLTDTHHNLNDVNLLELIQQVQESHQPIEQETTTRSGKRYLMRIVPYFIEHNIDVGVVLAFVDITSLRAAQEEVLSRQARLKSLYEAAPIGIGLCDTQNILEANDFLCQLAGRSREELLGLSLTLLFEQDDSTRNFWQDFKNASSKEMLLIAKDGQRIPVLVNTVAVHAGQNPKTYTFTVLDLTAYQEARREVEIHRQRYMLLFDSMLEGVVFQDESGKIVSANPSAERLLGLTLDQMLGRTSMDPHWRAIDRNGNPLPGDQHPAMISLRTGQPVRGFVMGVFNPQTERTNWLRINAVPLFENGKVVEVYTTFYDINDEIERGDVK